MIFPALTREGSQELLDRLANRLVIAAGGLMTLVAVPALVGQVEGSPVTITLVWIAAALLALISGALEYYAAARNTDPAAARSKAS